MKVKKEVLQFVDEAKVFLKKYKVHIIVLGLFAVAIYWMFGEE